MQKVEVSFRRYEGRHYRQEFPDRREFDVLSDLYLGPDVLSDKPMPERLRATIHFDDATPRAGSVLRGQAPEEIEVVVGFYREMSRTIRYRQEVPDPAVTNVIPDPYIGKQVIEQAVGNGPPPQKMRITLHLD